jgi:hypothetical protein
VSLQSTNELSTTRHKLERLESRYALLARESGGDEELREMTLTSLKAMINQLKEEIGRYQSRHLLAK